MCIRDSCCSQADTLANEGFILDTREALSPEYFASRKLSEGDFKLVLKRIVYLGYNAKLAEKRNLQEERAKTLKDTITPEYVKLLTATKAMEEEIRAAVEADALADLNVAAEDYETAKGSFDRRRVEEEVVESLLEDIGKNKHKLGVTESTAKTISSDFHNSYEKYNFMLNSYPNTGKDLYHLYGGENEYLNYLDIIAADDLYPKYKPVSYTHLTLPTICSV
eukprot:TRINITY_DN15042_c0_g1_i4.p1 TRINITY_DN15042_c0_g1~~TRINITY_DN15042_c0_g1_i4.p1  ORF type:complete len:222 (+),score=62.61 TRINITY_DN15042_c0_g1_i4:72-737(+)